VDFQVDGQWLAHGKAIVFYDPWTNPGAMIPPLDYARDKMKESLPLPTFVFAGIR